MVDENWLCNLVSTVEKSIYDVSTKYLKEFHSMFREWRRNADKSRMDGRDMRFLKLAWSILAEYNLDKLDKMDWYEAKLVKMEIGERIISAWKVVYSYNPLKLIYK